MYSYTTTITTTMLFVYCREKDVAGIDVNMGCPKEFSLKVGIQTTHLHVNALETNTKNTLST